MTDDLQPLIDSLLANRQGSWTQGRWNVLGRADQQTPPGDWHVWLILAGRGWGKTRTGAEDVRAFGLANPGSRIAVVAPTFADARDTCVEGESGLLTRLTRAEVDHWNRSLGELVLTNGTRYKLFSADEPDRLRGPQHHRAWCDELASFAYPDAWDQLLFGLRLGDKPQVVVTTTPKPVRLVRDLVGRPDVHVTRGSTFDNAENLAPAALDQLRTRYENTRMGRQELYAELLEDVEGALWRRDMIQYLPAGSDEIPDPIRVVVAIDPAVTSSEHADETGIIVAARCPDGRAYVLEDLSCRVSPDKWARVAVHAYQEWQADRIVAEVNNGGDLVGATIKTIDPNIPYTAVHASRGKRVRAEPVSALYEQHRVVHVVPFEALEDQMCCFLPESPKSPDRMDALVWALTELMVDDWTGSESGGLSVIGSSHRMKW